MAYYLKRVVWIMLVLPTFLFATDATTIMEKVYEHSKFHKEQVSTVRMEIVNRKKQKRERFFHSWKKYYGKSSKMLLKFSKPVTVKGTALLTEKKLIKNSVQYTKDQWIYLPSFKSIRQLQSNEKNKSFMGSDFSYADIGGRELADDRHFLIKETPQVYYIKSVPVDPTDSYGYMIMSIDKEKYVAKRIVFFDKKNKKLKTLDNKEFLYNKPVFTPKISLMTNHKSEGYTIIYVNDLNVHQTIEDTFLGPKGLRD